MVFKKVPLFCCCFCFRGVKTLPPWPLRGRARTKNLLKATQRRAPTDGRDFRNRPALANKTIAEGTPIRQYRANHDFGVPPSYVGSIRGAVLAPAAALVRLGALIGVRRMLTQQVAL